MGQNTGKRCDEIHTMALTLGALPGCNDAGDSLAEDNLEAGKLSGDRVRVGYPDCEGTLPLQELPMQRNFIYNNRLGVEQHLDDLTFTIDGRRVMGGRLNVTQILLDVSYSIAIDAVRPLRYAAISVHRLGYVLDDSRRREFRDRYESYGDFLTCRHEFERA